MSKPFQPGEACLLVDAKGRQYLIQLEEAGEFHYHAGFLAHRDILGKPEGTTLRSSSEARLTAFRPRLADYIRRMRRGAQVVYPKDIGPILVWADIAPGTTVVEAGTGSGALTMALVRAVGPAGRVISLELRPDHAEHARAVISGFFGGIPDNLELRIGDVSPAVVEAEPDRIILDIPDPWEVVPAAVAGLVPGGVFCAYLPTVPQIQQLREALRAAEVFIELSSFEVLHREWVAEGRSVRPEHRMVGHTGFITTARRLTAL